MFLELLRNYCRKLKWGFKRFWHKTKDRARLEVKNIRVKIMGKEYSFVTMDELVLWTCEWIKSFPDVYDVIVGIPRSGLLVANIIASKLGKPLTTPELFCQNQYWISKSVQKKEEYKNILLIDDSIYRGNAMKVALETLNLCRDSLNITKAALIVAEESKHLVDLYYKTLPQPRLFEWNFLHAKKGMVIAVDLDGVLCENCPPGVDVDEKLYTEWIKKAKPYLIPDFEIDAIISSRLEEYREDTERWLAEHNVRYKKLILWDIPSKDDRQGRYVEHKVEKILEVKPAIFWESSLGQAEKIWQATGIITLCIDKMMFFS